MVRRLWCGSEVNEEELFGVAERKSIGQGADSSVQICELQRRDTIAKARGEKVEVAAQELKHIPNDEDRNKQLGLFIRELYFQVDSRHPCIEHVFDGFSPDFRNDFDIFSNEGASSSEEENELQFSFIKSYIAMERMSDSTR